MINKLSEWLKNLTRVKYRRETTYIFKPRDIIHKFNIRGRPLKLEVTKELEIKIVVEN